MEYLGDLEDTAITGNRKESPGKVHPFKIDLDMKEYSVDKSRIYLSLPMPQNEKKACGLAFAEEAAGGKGAWGVFSLNALNEDGKREGTVYFLKEKAVTVKMAITEEEIILVAEGKIPKTYKSS